MFNLGLRRSAPSPTLPETLLLRAGQVLNRQLPAGTHLQLSCGEITLQEPPHWLAERVWQATHPLACGQALVLERGGWVTLWVHQDALLRISPPTAHRRAQPFARPAVPPTAHTAGVRIRWSKALKAALAPSPVAMMICL